MNLDEGFHHLEHLRRAGDPVLGSLVVDDSLSSVVVACSEYDAEAEILVVQTYLVDVACVTRDYAGKRISQYIPALCRLLPLIIIRVEKKVNMISEKSDARKCEAYNVDLKRAARKEQLYIARGKTRTIHLLYFQSSSEYLFYTIISY